MNKKCVDLFSPGPFGGAEQIILKSQKMFPNKTLWLIKEKRNPIPCEDFIQRCREENIKHEVFHSTSRFDIKLINNLKDKIKKDNIKIVHSHGLKANFCNSFLPVKKVATQHGLTSHNIKVRILEFIESLRLKKMDKVICVSKEMYDQKSYPNKIFIANFLSLNGQKQTYNKDGKLKLLFIGRLSKEKGIKELIPVIENREDIVLNVIGHGDLTYLFNSTQKNIHYHGFQKDIIPFMQEADALIMPSHREGMPMTLIEATAFGLPVIASDVGAISNLVDKNGVLFSPNNKRSMINAIDEFIKKRSEYNILAQKFSVKVKEQYSIETWVKKMKLLYQSC